MCCTVRYAAKIGSNCKILPNVMIGSKFSGELPGSYPSVISIGKGVGALLTAAII